MVLLKIRANQACKYPNVKPDPIDLISIDNQTNMIRYRFYWPEYFLLIMLVVPILAFRGGYLLNEDLTLLLIAVPFWAGIIFLDTKYVSSRVRKTLLKLSNT